MKNQKCKNCERDLVFTQIEFKDEDDIYVYMCDCNEMMKRAKAITTGCEKSEDGKHRGGWIKKDFGCLDCGKIFNTGK